ncbi:hypothetical protein RhiirB3_337353, partial [Rhizophagus irregularis]
RTTIVRLVSSAGTGYFFTKIRPRQLPKLSFVKFDPKGIINIFFKKNLFKKF